MNLPGDVAASVLDAIGSEIVFGDIEDGTRESQVILRAYQKCIMQLLRSAHWSFARKTAPLTLLADATGVTANVGAVVPTPWVYEYAYPTDCMKARFIPWNPATQASQQPGQNITTPVTQTLTNLGTPPNICDRIIPARFQIATDFNYPPQQGQITWEVQGLSPQGRTVVLTNVQNAQLVYTALMLYPSTWDPLFRTALEAYMASEVALALTKDKRLGLAIRGEQIKIAQAKITQARLADGNEGQSTISREASWMRTRRAGGAWGGAWGAGPGVAGYGWDSCAFADGSTY